MHFWNWWGLRPTGPRVSASYDCLLRSLGAVRFRLYCQIVSFAAELRQLILKMSVQRLYRACVRRSIVLKCHDRKSDSILCLISPQALQDNFNRIHVNCGAATLVSIRVFIDTTAVHRPASIILQQSAFSGHQQCQRNSLFVVWWL